MKKFLFILILLPFGLSAQQRDSLNFGVDTLLESSIFFNYENSFFTPQLFPINYSQFSFELEPVLDRNRWFAPNVGRFVNEGTRILRSATPLAIANYGYGYENAHWLNAQYGMTVKNTEFGLSFSRSASKANINNGNTKVLNFQGRLSGHHNWYHYRFGIYRNSNTIGESGGVKSDSLFQSVEEVTSTSVQTNFSNASNELHDQGAYFENKFLFHQNVPDSLRDSNYVERKNVLGLVINGYVKEEGYTFSMNQADIDSGYFAHIYADSTETFDSIGNSSIKGEIGLGLFELESLQARAQVLYGISRNSEAQLNEDFVKVKINGKFHNEGVRLSGAYFLNGYRKGGYYGSLSITDTTINNVLLKGQINYSSLKPHYFYNNYFSNHFSWNNSFEAINHLDARVIALHNKYKLRLTLNGQRISNWIYFTELAPNQVDYSINYFALKAQHTFQRKWFNIHTAATYQSADSKLIRFPSYWVRNSFAFKFNFNQVPFTLGYMITYFPAFKGYAYNPGFRNFYVQDETEVGNFPLLGAFFTARVGPADIYFRAENILYWTKPKAYYLAPNYPITSGLLRFGFKWKFLN